MSPPELYLGLMSGTSMDGVDAVLATIHSTGGLQVLAHRHCPMPEELRALCLSLNSSGDDELDGMQRAGNHLANWYANAIHGLLAEAKTPAKDILAIGVHGQTVRHQPNGVQGVPNSRYTVQLNNPALLAELTGIDVIAHFRERDLAAGGQGAPLVPAFHRQCFGETDRNIAVVNIGGIANVTWLGADQSCLGWDSGPGNMLLDAWCELHTGKPWDEGGEWAASGRIQSALLHRWMQDPYFRRSGAKSSGRDYFGVHWLDQDAEVRSLAPEDVQATLVALTAHSIVDSLPSEPDRLLVCGGGALNPQLMSAMVALLPQTEVVASSAAGLPPMQVEAAAFAWLAWAWVHRVPGNWPAATGAKGPRVLGALFPA